VAHESYIEKIDYLSNLVIRGPPLGLGYILLIPALPFILFLAFILPIATAGELIQWHIPDNGQGLSEFVRNSIVIHHENAHLKGEGELFALKAQAEDFQKIPTPQTLESCPTSTVSAARIFVSVFTKTLIVTAFIVAGIYLCLPDISLWEYFGSPALIWPITALLSVTKLRALISFLIFIPAGEILGQYINIKLANPGEKSFRLNFVLRMFLATLLLFGWFWSLTYLLWVDSLPPYLIGLADQVNTAFISVFIIFLLHRQFKNLFQNVGDEIRTMLPELRQAVAILMLAWALALGIIFSIPCSMETKSIIVAILQPFSAITMSYLANRRSDRGGQIELREWAKPVLVFTLVFNYLFFVVGTMWLLNIPRLRIPMLLTGVFFYVAVVLLGFRKSVPMPADALPLLQNCLTIACLDNYARGPKNIFSDRSDINQRLREVFRYAGPSIENFAGHNNLIINEPQLRFINWYSSFMGEDRPIFDILYLQGLYRLILRSVNFNYNFQKNFAALSMATQLLFLNKANESLGIIEGEITAAYLRNPANRGKLAYLYETIGVVYMVSYDEEIPSMMDEVYINSCLASAGLNLYRLTHMTIDEVEGILNINPSRITSRRISYQDESEERAYYRRLQADIEAACGITPGKQSAARADLDVMVSSRRRTEWGRNRMLSVPMEDIDHALIDLFRNNEGKFIRDTLSKKVGHEIALKHIDNHIVIELRNEAARSGIYKVYTGVSEGDSGQFKPCAFGLAVAKCDFLNRAVENEFNTVNHFRQICRYVMQPYCCDRVSISVAGINTELAVFSMEWKEGFEEVNFVSRRLARDRPEDFGDLVQPAESGAGVVLSAYNPARGLTTLVPLDNEQTGRNIKEEIVKIITLCFDPEKGERLEDSCFNAGDFVYNPDTKEVSLISCRGIRAMNQEGMFEYTKEQVNVYDFIFWLLSTKTISQGICWLPPGHWGDYEEIIFEPQDVFNGIKKALIEKYGPREGIRKLVVWFKFYNEVTKDSLAHLLKDAEPPADPAACNPAGVARTTSYGQRYYELLKDARWSSQVRAWFIKVFVTPFMEPIDFMRKPGGFARFMAAHNDILGKSSLHKAAQVWFRLLRVALRFKNPFIKWGIWGVGYIPAVISHSLYNLGLRPQGAAVGVARKNNRGKPIQPRRDQELEALVESIMASGQQEQKISGGIEINMVTGPNKKRFVPAEGHTASPSVTLFRDRIARGEISELVDLCGEEEVQILLAKLIDSADFIVEVPDTPKHEAIIDTVLRLKAKIDLIQMISIAMAMEAVVNHLKGERKDYAPLLGYLNEYLINSHTRNKRLAQMYGSIPAISSATQIQRLELWGVKSGYHADVIRVEVKLVDQRTLRFAVNVSRDLRDAVGELQRAFDSLKAKFAQNSTYIMEPFTLGIGNVSSWRGEESVPLMVSEWLDGFDELHLMETTGSRIRVRYGQDESKDALPEPESDQVWQTMTRIRTLYSELTTEKGTALQAHVIAGDFVGKKNAKGGWEVMVVWTQDNIRKQYAREEIVLNALLQGEVDFLSSYIFCPGAILWERFDLAIPAFVAGFVEAGGRKENALEILRLVYKETLPRILKSSESHPVVIRLQEAYGEEILVRLRKLRRAIGKFLGEEDAEPRKQEVSDEESTDRPSLVQNVELEDIIGAHPFKVQAVVGPDKTPLYGEDGTFLSNKGPTIGTLEQLRGFPYQKLIADLKRDCNISEEMLLFILRKSRNIRGVMVPTTLEKTILPYLDAIIKLKKALLTARVLDGEEIIQAVMLHLAGADSSYQNLLRYINHILSNQGQNPRFAAILSSEDKVKNVQEIESLELWFVKEGSITEVVAVEVQLRDIAGRQSKVRFVVNVPLDRTKCVECLRHAYSRLHTYYQRNPSFVMEPFALGTEEVPLLVGEWVENSDELHLYHETGAKQFHVWAGQEQRKDVIRSVEDSREIWKQIIQARVMYSQLLPEMGILPCLLFVNRGDYVVYDDMQGSPHVVLIWDGSLSLYKGIYEDIKVFNPVDIVINMLYMFDRDSDSGKEYLICFDEPDLAIQILEETFPLCQPYPELAKSLLQMLFITAYTEGFPSLIEMLKPEESLGRLLDSSEQPKLYAAAVKAYEALGRYLKGKETGLGGTGIYSQEEIKQMIEEDRRAGRIEAPSAQLKRKLSFANFLASPNIIYLRYIKARGLINAPPKVRGYQIINSERIRFGAWLSDNGVLYLERPYLPQNLTLLISHERIEKVTQDHALAQRLAPLIQLLSANPPTDTYQMVQVPGTRIIIYSSRDIPLSDDYTLMFVNLITRMPRFFKRKKALDMGTGSAALAKTLLGYTNMEKVVASDIIPQAVELARINLSEEISAGRALVRQSDLYENIRDLFPFDVILFANPFIEGDPDRKNILSYSTKAGKGYSTVIKALQGLPQALTPGGNAFFVATSGYLGENSPFLNQRDLKNNVPAGWDVQDVGESYEARQGIYFSVFRVYDLSKENGGVYVELTPEAPRFHLAAPQEFSELMRVLRQYLPIYHRRVESPFAPGHYPGRLIPADLSWRAPPEKAQREYFERASKQYELRYDFDPTLETVAECSLFGATATFSSELLARAPPLKDTRNSQLFQVLINEFLRHEKGHSENKLDPQILTESLNYFIANPKELKDFLEALRVFGVEITDRKYLAELKKIDSLTSKNKPVKAAPEPSSHASSLIRTQQPVGYYLLRYLMFIDGLTEQYNLVSSLQIFFFGKMPEKYFKFRKFGLSGAQQQEALNLLMRVYKQIVSQMDETSLDRELLQDLLNGVVDEVARIYRISWQDFSDGFDASLREDKDVVDREFRIFLSYLEPCLQEEASDRKWRIAQFSREVKSKLHDVALIYLLQNIPLPWQVGKTRGKEVSWRQKGKFWVFATQHYGWKGVCYIEVVYAEQADNQPIYVYFGASPPATVIIDEGLYREYAGSNRSTPAMQPTDDTKARLAEAMEQDRKALWAALGRGDTSVQGNEHVLALSIQIAAEEEAKRPHWQRLLVVSIFSSFWFALVHIRGVVDMEKVRAGDPNLWRHPRLGELWSLFCLAQATDKVYRKKYHEAVKHSLGLRWQKGIARQDAFAEAIQVHQEFNRAAFLQKIPKKYHPALTSLFAQGVPRVPAMAERENDDELIIIDPKKGTRVRTIDYKSPIQLILGSEGSKRFLILKAKDYLELCGKDAYPISDSTNKKLYLFELIDPGGEKVIPHAPLELTATTILPLGSDIPDSVSEKNCSINLALAGEAKLTITVDVNTNGTAYKECSVASLQALLTQGYRIYDKKAAEQTEARDRKAQIREEGDDGLQTIPSGGTQPIPYTSPIQLVLRHKKILILKPADYLKLCGENAFPIAPNINFYICELIGPEEGNFAAHIPIPLEANGLTLGSSEQCSHGLRMPKSVFPEHCVIKESESDTLLVTDKSNTKSTRWKYCNFDELSLLLEQGYRTYGEVQTTSPIQLILGDKVILFLWPDDYERVSGQSLPNLDPNKIYIFELIGPKELIGPEEGSFDPQAPIPFETTELTLGRDTNYSYHMHMPGTVSRVHCSIRFSEPDKLLVFNRSPNGTLAENCSIASLQKLLKQGYRIYGAQPAETVKKKARIFKKNDIYFVAFTAESWEDELPLASLAAVMPVLIKQNKLKKFNFSFTKPCLWSWFRPIVTINKQKYNLKDSAQCHALEALLESFMLETTEVQQIRPEGKPTEEKQHHLVRTALIVVVAVAIIIAALIYLLNQLGVISTSRLIPHSFNSSPVSTFLHDLHSQSGTRCPIASADRAALPLQTVLSVCCLVGMMRSGGTPSSARPQDVKGNPVKTEIGAILELKGYIRILASNKTLSETDIKRLHQLVCDCYAPSMAKIIGGRYRTKPTRKTAGDDTNYLRVFDEAQTRQIPQMMVAFLYWFNQEYQSVIGRDVGSLVLFAAEAHYRLTHEIHPFEDKNGSTARALVNIIYEKSGTPKKLPINLSEVFYDNPAKVDYYDTFRLSERKQAIQLLSQFIIENLESETPAVPPTTNPSAKRLRQEGGFISLPAGVVLTKRMVSSSPVVKVDGRSTSEQLSGYLYKLLAWLKRLAHSPSLFMFVFTLGAIFFGSHSPYEFAGLCALGMMMNAGKKPLALSSPAGEDKAEELSASQGSKVAPEGSLRNTNMLLTWSFSDERDRIKAPSKADAFLSVLDEKLVEIGLLKRDWIFIKVPCIEMALNIMNHGQGGNIEVRCFKDVASLKKVEATGIDKGSGMDNPNEFLQRSIVAHSKISAYGRGEIPLSEVPEGGRGLRDIVIFPDEVIIETKGKKWVRTGVTDEDMKFEYVGNSDIKKGMGTRIVLAWNYENTTPTPR
jgi:methylase of polypeptide subunit release factors/anti-sigma regulatory factor (Ser/Thr protein kinase)